MNVDILIAMTVDGLTFVHLDNIAKWNFHAQQCPHALTHVFQYNFSRSYLSLETSHQQLSRQIWGRILLYTPLDEEKNNYDGMDILNYSYPPDIQMPRMWKNLPSASLRTGESPIAAHKAYYKEFREIELSRVEMISRERLWRHPITLVFYNMKFVSMEEPFKVPCQVYTRKRFISNFRNVIFKCGIKHFIESEHGGDKNLRCEPFYRHAWVFNKTGHNNVVDVVEQMYGDQLADGGGFYMHVFPINEPVYQFTKEDKAELLAFSSGIFYCAEDETANSRPPEVVQVVDIVSFKEARNYHEYERHIHKQLNSTSGFPLNLQYHVIWQDWEACCSRSSDGKQVRFGIVTVRKIDPTKTIFGETEAISYWTDLPISKQFKDNRKELVLIDLALSLPIFYEHGIRVSSAYAYEIQFEKIMTELIGTKIPISVLYDYKECEVSIEKRAECLMRRSPKRRPQYYPLRSSKASEAKRPKAISSSRNVNESVCIPCTIPRKIHFLIQRKGSAHVVFQLHQHIIISCADPGKRLNKTITWHKEKGPPIQECRGLNTTFVLNGELHIHAAKHEDMNTYVCKSNGKQVKYIRLDLASGKWISDFWLCFCIIVPGTLLILGSLIWCHIIPDWCIKSTGVGMIAQMALDQGREMMEMQRQEKEAQGLEKVKLYVARKLARNRRIHA
uniref:Ig-like domain-containing protein n=1 Tax=Trichuris muris TaxID=70415 RepID=A0A5S6QUL1_TRIMR